MRMRNPSHQLNAGYGAKDMPDLTDGGVEGVLPHGPGLPDGDDLASA